MSTTQTQDFTTFNVQELKKYCKDNKIHIKATFRKQQIIDEIMKYVNISKKSDVKNDLKNTTTKSDTKHIATTKSITKSETKTTNTTILQKTSLQHEHKQHFSTKEYHSSVKTNISDYTEQQKFYLYSIVHQLIKLECNDYTQVIPDIFSKMNISPDTCLQLALKHVFGYDSLDNTGMNIAYNLGYKTFNTRYIYETSFKPFTLDKVLVSDGNKQYDCAGLELVYSKATRINIEQKTTTLDYETIPRSKNTIIDTSSTMYSVEKTDYEKKLYKSIRSTYTTHNQQYKTTFSQQQSICDKYSDKCEFNCDVVIVFKFKGEYIKKYSDTDTTSGEYTITDNTRIKDHVKDFDVKDAETKIKSSYLVIKCVRPCTNYFEGRVVESLIKLNALHIKISDVEMIEKIM